MSNAMDAGSSTPTAARQVVCLGVFDGVHRGHVSILGAAKRFAHGIERSRVTAVTFDPHPSTVVRPDHPQPLLQPLQDRADCLRSLGCHTVIVLPFNQDMSSRSPEEFWSILREAVPGQIVGLFAGRNWRFGAGRSGDMSTLARLARPSGCLVVGVPPIIESEHVISSSWIRQSVQVGDLGQAERLLGKPFGISGLVIQGKQLARQWGVPTANFIPEQECLPPFGVYVADVFSEGSPLAKAVVNIGVRPSLHGGHATAMVEAHLIDFDGNLYGRKITVIPFRQMRTERRFETPEELRIQILKDVADAKDCLASRIGTCSEVKAEPT